jgi:Amt family ammonium transporter
VGGYKRSGILLCLGVGLFLESLIGIPEAGAAGEALKIDTGDTAWVLTSTALVLAMTMPGLALFYGGMVRRKNILGTIMQSIVVLCLVSLIWILVGYSLAFGPDQGGLIGSLEWAGLKGVGSAPHPTYGPTIPHQVFMLFQLMFAAITPALITGAVAERMKFSALLLFASLWSLFIYVPVAHWVWGGGWLGQMGAIDFAGGAVVHITSGVSSLVCAIVIGKRKGWGADHMPPHNLPFTLLGTGLLWFGWFGFNAGSALGANGVAGSAFLATQAAAATGALVWMVVEWMHRGKPTVLGVASGVVAGLAAVTPASGYIGPFSAILIGAVAGVLCYYAVYWKGRMSYYDDSLDSVGIHGVSGVFGILATGLFASKAINAAGADGLFFGNAGLLGTQAIMAGAVGLFSVVGTWIILKLVDAVLGLRVSSEDEQVGLDLSQHNEQAYSHE